MTDARLLGGRYELGGPLGYGGMAEVHRGRDLRLGRDVAVKVLRSDLARDPGFQARFRREAQNAAALNHPSIVAVYDTGEDRMSDNGMLPFIVMEYVEGRTLKEVLVSEGRLMPQRALEITADICAALDFSHRNGIIHRDMKPGNVMMTPNGTVKVMDFGIARAITSATAAMTQTSAVIGTAQYLSPEQARGETVDARSDVYSTGCLLYELLCGNPPFTGDNPVSVAYQHVREDPIPPSELNPDVTPEIDAIVLKAMAKNPLNRYQSAGEMRADLLRAAAGRPVSATPVYSSAERTQIIGGGGGRRGNTGMIPTEPVEQPRRRKGLTWLLVGLGVIAVFLLAAWGTSYLFGGEESKVEVPTVTGQPFATAKQQLEAEGFKVTAVRVESSAADKDKVLRQNPGGGERVDKGTPVTLDVGAGPNQTKVPDLKGLDQAGAEASLIQEKLKPKFVTEAGPEPAGAVTRFSPGAGTTVPVNSEVTVWISDGKLKRVPQVVGDSQDEAEQKIIDAGFTFVVRTQVTSSKAPGTVIQQDPEQNSLRAAGTRVTITVAKAPAPSPTPSPTEPSPTPSESEKPTKPPTTSISPTPRA